MLIETYLNFNGECEEAMEYYAQCLGGKLEAIMHWAGSPAEEHAPPEWGNKVLHASLRVGHCRLMGCDTPPGSYNPPQGFGVTLAMDDADEAERIFTALAKGGAIQMPFEETFFAEHFGMATDRFGIPWMILQGTGDASAA